MTEEIETMGTGELVYRATTDAVSLREEGDASPVLEGRMVPYDEWTEVDSQIEGHFMERFAPGALAKTIAERATRVRALFEHGFGFLDKQSIAQIEEMRDEPDGAYFRASLLDGLPPLLLAGLRRGLYGSSVRFGPIKAERVRSPKKSERNPKGLPEHTIREAKLQEFSVVTFPQYDGATAQIRSITDEIAAHKLLEDPKKLLELMHHDDVEPQHSGRQEQVDPAPRRSRSTQPAKDYLNTEKEAPEWRL